MHRALHHSKHDTPSRHLKPYAVPDIMRTTGTPQAIVRSGKGHGVGMLLSTVSPNWTAWGRASGSAMR